MSGGVVWYILGFINGVGIGVSIGALIMEYA